MYKKAILFSLFSIMSACIFASFPVNKDNVKKSNEKVESVETINKEAVGEIEMPNLTLDENAALSPAAASSDSNEMIILLLLWFFLGGLAAHRWYARKPTGWNILFILTLGGLGIWWLVDMILILRGDFMND